MVSNTHEDSQTVVSKEITLTSPPRNTYGSNNAESFSSKIIALSKNEEQLKSYVQHDNNNAENKEVVAENLLSHNENDLSKEVIAIDNETDQLSHIQEEINICDTCGDQGFVDSLVICSKCKMRAEHTYCMVVKVADPHKGWICYECANDKDGVREGEETSSMKMKTESFIEFFKMDERKLSQKQPDLLNKGLNIDSNVDPNKDMNEELSSRKRKIRPSTDCPKMQEEASSQAELLNTKKRCRIMWLDLNKDHNPDFDEDPNINVNMDP